MQHVVWLIPSTSASQPLPYTHTWTVIPLIYKASSLHIMLWLRGTMADSVNSWQAQTHSPNQLSWHTHAFCLRRNRRKWWTGEESPAQRDCARGDTPAELNTKLPAPSSRQRPTSQPYVANHAFTTCYATQRTAAIGYMIIWTGRSLRPRTYWDIGYLCWTEKQKWSLRDYSGGKEKKGTDTLLDKWMTAERVAGQRQGKPCGLLNCIPLRLQQCDDAHDDEDNK